MSCKECLLQNTKVCEDCARLSNVMEPNPMFVKNDNYNRIRNMTVEEMAKKLVTIAGDSIAFCVNKEKCEEMLNSDREIPEEMCVECMKEWLLQEVADE